VAEFTNPNQQGAPQDNRPLLVIMALMVVAFIGLNFYRAKTTPPVTTPNVATTQSVTAQPPVQAGASIATLGVAKAGVAANTVVKAEAETTTVVENELYRITFSNRGGQATSWILKKQKTVDGKQLDLVHADAASTVGYPLSLYTYDAGLTANLAKALYLPSQTGKLDAPATLTYRFSAGGYDVTKTFSFDASYVVHADTVVLRDGVPIRTLIAWPGGFGDQNSVAAYGGGQLDYSQNGGEKHKGPKDVSGGATLLGGYDWAGVSDLYYAAIFLPDSPDTATVATLHSDIVVVKPETNGGWGKVPPPPPPLKTLQDLQPFADKTFVCKDIKVPSNGLCVPMIGAALGDLSGHTRANLFVGPKAVDVLRNVHAANPKLTLEPLLDFGFFGFFGKYLFLGLRALHDHVLSSWGWDIVYLTIGINLIILPLRIKTMQSGLKMQRIQPQMDAIKARYKNLKMTDPKRNDMQAEILQLQKDNGVNMFGGCIPTLIQMPLLFAMFGMLPKVVELRQAHWFWLPDLTAADPWHILPIVMVLSQFLVQFYTPSPGVDPQQQKMMAFMMPAVSGYMTWNYSSGLALYWSVGNLISIATQAVMNRTSLGAEMREIAARRARRKAGIGGSVKTIQGKGLQAKAKAK
jgi:YidC/Oxa1 family membrane protein insertase